MGIFDFAKKRRGKMSIDELLAALDEARREEDEVKIANLFWEIASRYQEEEKYEKAMVYLTLFDDLVGGDDDLYDRFQSQDEDAMKQIDELSRKQSFGKEVRDILEEKEKGLTNMQKVQWIILSLARMNGLFDRFSEFDGFEVFCDYEEVIGILAKVIYQGCDAEEEETLDDFVMDIEDVETSAMLSVENRIANDGYADYEAMDLIGSELYVHMMDAFNEITDFLENDEECEISLNVIESALHAGYYARICEKSLYEIPALAAGKQRIMSDYEYIKGEPGEADFAMKVEEYLSLDWKGFEN